MSIFTTIKRCYHNKCTFRIVKSIDKDQIDDVLPGINMGISKSGNDLHNRKKKNMMIVIKIYIHMIISYSVGTY